MKPQHSLSNFSRKAREKIHFPRALEGGRVGKCNPSKRQVSRCVLRFETARPYAAANNSQTPRKAGLQGAFTQNVYPRGHKLYLFFEIHPNKTLSTNSRITLCSYFVIVLGVKIFSHFRCSCLTILNSCVIRKC